MVYFLGRDVHAALTTEHSFCGISILPENGEAYVDNVLLSNGTGVVTGSDSINGSVHGLTTGDPINLTMDGAQAIPAGLEANKRFFAIVTDADTIKVAATYAHAIAGTPVDDITGDDNDSLINVTRELMGTSDSVYEATADSHHTSIFNREWPRYDGTGRIDTIGAEVVTQLPLKYSAAANKNVLNDVTAIDVTLGKMDEDINLFGIRTALKAEVKNEVTVVITKKKTNALFEILFNKARCGVITYSSAGVIDLDNAAPLAATMKLPNHTLVELNNSVNATLTTPSRNFGYRLHLELKNGTETMTLQNLCITDYTISLSADGVTEESITFYGYVAPKVDALDGGYFAVTTAAEL